MKTLRFFDNEYPNNGYNHTRKVVRGILLNEKNEVALVKLYGYDSFGYRSYYETPGGGKEKYESNIKTLKRELLEEVGVTIKNIKPIAKVIDFYNLINRRNINYYYLCRVKTYEEQHLEEYEKELMSGLVWVPLNEVIKVYQDVAINSISRLCIQREVPILEMAVKMSIKD